MAHVSLVIWMLCICLAGRLDALYLPSWSSGCFVSASLVIWWLHISASLVIWRFFCDPVWPSGKALGW